MEKLTKFILMLVILAIYTTGVAFAGIDEDKSTIANDTHYDFIPIMENNGNNSAFADVSNINGDNNSGNISHPIFIALNASLKAHGGIVYSDKTGDSPGPLCIFSLGYSFTPGLGFHLYVGNKTPSYLQVAVAGNHVEVSNCH